MKYLMMVFSLTFLTVGSLGCSTTKQSSVIAFAPAKSANCELEVISLDMSDPTFNQKWKMLGSVTITDVGNMEPFSAEVIAELKPEACKIGGDGISVMKTAGQNATGDGSSINYLVFQDRSKTPAETGVPSKI